MTEIPTPLKTVRKRRGLTQIEVSSAVRVDNGTYSRIENGHSTATAAVARRIAKFFGHEVTEMQILYPEDYMTPDEPETK